MTDSGQPDAAAPEPLALDIVDVRLLEAIHRGGCPICVVRARSERATIDSIIRERVLDIGFRAGLERREGFCRRHVAELVPADRRETGGILGSSLLLSAVIDRRLDVLRDGVGERGRRLRTRLGTARHRPPCIACTQGASAVETALARMTERASDPGWAALLAAAPFCLDDLIEVWAASGGDPAFQPIVRRQLSRFEDLRVRLEGFAHHSSHDRLQLMTDLERTAADEATRALGGDPPD
jgi:hypothetical protein